MRNLRNTGFVPTLTLVVLIIITLGFLAFNHSFKNTKPTAHVEEVKKETPPTIEIKEENPNIAVEDNPACTVLRTDLEYPMLIDTDVDVRRLQDFLYREGYLALPSTGYFGTITRDAVRNFQKHESIFATGIVDAVTRGRIQELSCAYPGNELYRGAMRILFPSANQVLQRGEGKMISWTSGYIADQNESQNQQYDVRIVALDSNKEDILFTNVSRAGYFWTIGEKDSRPNGYPDGHYKLRVCLTGTATCITGEPFSIVTNSPKPIACPSIPCFYDGKFYTNDRGVVDSPPYTTADYPYEFDVAEEMPTKLVIRGDLGNQGGQNGTVATNVMTIFVDNKQVFQVSNTWNVGTHFVPTEILEEIDLGVMSAGPHFITIKATSQRHVGVDWFRVMRAVPGERYLDW